MPASITLTCSTSHALSPFQWIVEERWLSANWMNEAWFVQVKQSVQRVLKITSYKVKYEWKTWRETIKNKKWFTVLINEWMNRILYFSGNNVLLPLCLPYSQPNTTLRTEWTDLSRFNAENNCRLLISTLSIGSWCGVQ